MMKTGAKAVSLKATSCAVTVVPILEPKMMPTLFLKESTPALTRLMAMTEVAELDWMTAVTKAPISTPTTGIFVVLARNFRNFSPEIRWISSEKFSRPKTNRIVAVNPVRKMLKCSIVSYRTPKVRTFVHIYSFDGFRRERCTTALAGAAIRPRQNHSSNLFPATRSFVFKKIQAAIASWCNRGEAHASNEAERGRCVNQVGEEREMQKYALVFMLSLLVPLASAQAGQLVVTMNVLEGQDVGKAAGTITVSENVHGIVFTPALSGLAPGAHGFHVHLNPSCAAAEKDGKLVPGLAAGGHYDPGATGKHLGPYAEGHFGDLPVLYADADGKATIPVLAPRLQLTDLAGRSLMIHAGGDNYSDTPAALGGGGARAACGVVK